MCLGQNLVKRPIALLERGKKCLAGCFSKRQQHRPSNKSGQQVSIPILRRLGSEVRQEEIVEGSRVHQYQNILLKFVKTSSGPCAAKLIETESVVISQAMLP